MYHIDKKMIQLSDKSQKFISFETLGTPRKSPTPLSKWYLQNRVTTQLITKTVIYPKQ